jgi:3-hydroxybutyryl-CoA dehydratase
MITGYFDELEVGTVTHSRGRTITEADVVAFAGLSGDLHPLHTDAVYAAKGPFGERIGHGMLTLAVTSGLMTLSAESVRAFYGMDRVRFLRPVRFGDTLTVRSQVELKEPLNDDSGKVTLAVTVTNQDEEPVMAVQMRFVVGKKPA